MAKKYYVARTADGEVRLFDNWADCSDFITGRRGVTYHGYSSKQEAVEAYRGSGADELLLLKAVAEMQQREQLMAEATLPADRLRLPALAVDAACSRNPGPVEYQGVWLPDRTLAFRQGPYEGGTNNIGEYLALVHALALLEKLGRPDITVYSDSRTAMAWVRNRQPRTALIPSAANARIFELMNRATAWLRTHTPRNPILKWDTPSLGEIPADFGRK